LHDFVFEVIIILYARSNERAIYLVRNKYLDRKSLTQVAKKAGNFQFWSGLMQIKDQFISKGWFKIDSGNQTRFWEDICVGG
jgi:hypothetical protein